MYVRQKISFINHKFIKTYSISYIERGENMTEIVKFVNLMIILLSVFIVAMNVDAFEICGSNSDCLWEKCLPPNKHWCNMIETIMFEGFAMGKCECI
ncbi:putative Late nodulin [Medicago truncatula]|nr:putative Late nodulin [Medicago truncatula]